MIFISMIPELTGESIKMMIHDEEILKPLVSKMTEHMRKEIDSETRKKIQVDPD